MEVSQREQKMMTKLIRKNKELAELKAEIAETSII